MKNSGFIVLALLTLAVLGASGPVIIWGGVRAMENMENAPPFWVPPTFRQRREFDRFIDDFGYQDIVVISWQGCTIDDVRLRRLEARLQSSQPTPHGNPAKFFRTVYTGYSAVRELMDPPLRLSRREAIERLKGNLIGPDGRTSCAVIVLNYPEPNQRPAIKETILDVAEQQVGLPRDAFYLGGSIIDGVAIDVENNRSNLYAIPSALLSLLLCRICLKSWKLTLPVLIVAAFGEGLMLAMIYYTGTTMNAVLAVMSPLVFVLTVSAGVHLVNYFQDEVRLRGVAGAAGRALAAGWSPCVVAAVTTAIGLGSLMVSEIVPIQQFGGFSAIGVLVTLCLLFLLVPGAMVWWGARRNPSAGARGAAAAAPAASPAGASPRSGSAAAQKSDRPPAERSVVPEQMLAAAVCRYAPWIVLVGFAVMVVTGYGLLSVRTSVNVRSLLVPSSRTIQDYRWLESHLGPLIPVEIVLHFDRSCPLDLLERLELVRHVQQTVDRIGLLGGTTSAATFFPDIPAPAASWRRIGRRVVLRKRLQRERQHLIDARWLHEADGRQSWRISTRVRALNDLDYGRFLDQLRQQVDPLLQNGPGQGVRATYTGIMPLIYAAQRALLHDLFVSFLTALVLVTLVMMLVLRSGAAGLVAMIPNIFPAIVLFGGMGWLRISVDIGTMMTASVALGIAVDGTIHFLTWFRRELGNGHSTRTAVQKSFRHCARAMTYTTIICGLGLLVFTLSQFLPTRRFAWMMFTLLAAALAGDLLLLPALLVGPVGRTFSRRRPGAAKADR